MPPSTNYQNCLHCTFLTKQCDRLKRRIALLSKLICDPPPISEDNNTQTDSSDHCLGQISVTTQTDDSFNGEQVFCDEELFKTYISEPAGVNNVSGNDDELFKLFVKNNTDQLINTAGTVCNPEINMDDLSLEPYYLFNNQPFSMFDVSVLDKETNFLAVNNRSLAYYGDVPYSYGRISHVNRPLPENGYLNHILKQVSMVMPNFKFNSILLTKFEDGNDFLPYHSDNEDSIHPSSAILTISLGAQREILFRSDNSEAESLPLRHGDSYLMTRASQNIFKHCVPRDNSSGVRISITLRFLSPSKEAAADIAMVTEFIDDLANHESQHSTTPVTNPGYCAQYSSPVQTANIQLQNTGTDDSVYHDLGTSAPKPMLKDTTATGSTTLYISSSMFAGLDERKLSSDSQTAKVLFYRGATAATILYNLQSDPKFLGIDPNAVGKVYLLCGTNNVDKIADIPHHRKGDYVAAGNFSLNHHELDTTMDDIANLALFLHDRFRTSTVNLINLLPRVSSLRNLVINSLNEFLSCLCKEYDFLQMIGTEASRRLFSNNNGHRKSAYFSSNGSDNVHLSEAGVHRLANHLKYLSHR